MKLMNIASVALGLITVGFFSAQAAQPAEAVPPVQTAQPARAVASLVGGAQAAMHQVENPLVEDLLVTIKGPTDHDRATHALGLDARLLNLNFASEIDTALGRALYLPVQVSTREGGRKSLYYIVPGEEVITGALIIDSKVYYRSVQKDSGASVPAQTGDRYTSKILDTQGNVVDAVEGTLTVLNPNKGIGEFRPLDPNDRRYCTWTAWSFYYDCIEDY